jgi:hypothetical protein
MKKWPGFPMNNMKKIGNALDHVMFEHRKECADATAKEPDVVFNDVPYHMQIVRDQCFDSLAEIKDVC